MNDADSLEDDVKYPRRLSGDVDVVDTIPCACAVTLTTLVQGYCQDEVYVLHDRGAIIPERAYTVEDDFGLLDDTLDSLFVVNVEFE